MIKRHFFNTEKNFISIVFKAISLRDMYVDLAKIDALENVVVG